MLYGHEGFSSPFGVLTLLVLVLFHTTDLCCWWFIWLSQYTGFIVINSSHYDQPAGYISVWTHFCYNADRFWRNVHFLCVLNTALHNVQTFGKLLDASVDASTVWILWNCCVSDYIISKADCFASVNMPIKCCPFIWNTNRKTLNFQEIG